MTPDQLAELKNNPILLDRLAKKLVHDCFRNSKLEEFQGAHIHRRGKTTTLM
jgi:hypothetical protein